MIWLQNYITSFCRVANNSEPVSVISGCNSVAIVSVVGYSSDVHYTAQLRERDTGMGTIARSGCENRMR